MARGVTGSMASGPVITRDSVGLPSSVDLLRAPRTSQQGEANPMTTWYCESPEDAPPTDPNAPAPADKPAEDEADEGTAEAAPPPPWWAPHPEPAEPAAPAPDAPPPSDEPA